MRSKSARQWLISETDEHAAESFSRSPVCGNTPVEMMAHSRENLYCTLVLDLP